MLAKLKRLFRSPAATSSSRRARVCRPTLEVLEERRLLSANLFGVGGDGRVYEQQLDASGHAYNDWAPTSDTGRIISNVSTSTDVSGNVHLFGVGGNGNVYEQDLDGNGHAVSGWYSTDTTAGVTSNVNLSSDDSGHMHLFGVGRDGRVYEQDLDASDHAVTSWFATSSTGQIYSDVSQSGGWFASNGVSVLGSLNTEPAAGL